MKPCENNVKPVILIVDDQADNIRLLSGLLRENYSSITATNGRKAIEIALSDNRPDLILLDIIMPDMDGYEVCRRLKDDERSRDIPVIFITGKNDVRNEIRGFEAGAVDFLTRPFHPGRLEARMRAHLRNRRQEMAGFEENCAQKMKMNHLLSNYKHCLEKMREQIDSAVDIYHNLIELKHSCYKIKMTWRHQPLISLGGDFIDIRENGDTLTVLVADVAGHDMGASYHTILLKAFFEENCHKGSGGPALFHMLNRHILESGGEKRMITALFLCYHRRDMICEIISAAHPWLVLMKKSEQNASRVLKTGGNPLGLRTDAEFVTKRLRLSPSDRLFIHTDGVQNVSRLNTRTGEREKLLTEGLDDFLLKYSHTLLEDSVSFVWRDLLQFCRGKPRDDLLLFGMEIPGTG